MPKPPFPDATTLSDSAKPSQPRLPPEVRPQLGRSAADLIAFSNVFPAAIAAGLSLAVSRALGADEALRWAILAASGTYIVYALDRLRDLARDRETSPRRTEFVERHHRSITITAAISGVALVVTLVGSPLPVILLCIGVGAVGLLHRRLKRSNTLKSVYVTIAWVAICVGIPATTDWNVKVFAWVAAIVGAAIAGNLVASNLTGEPGSQSPRGSSPGLGLARGFAVCGSLVCWLAPPEVAPLGWIPFAEAGALLFFRASEYYDHLAVDGALFAGALLSLAHFQLA